MDFSTTATFVWLAIGIVLLAYILKHNVGRVLKGLLITYGVLGVGFAVSLISVNYEILISLYHLWVTVLLFILIMLILAVGGR